MADGFVLEIPEQVGVALATARTPQAKTKDWPEGTIVVSADSHMLEKDCWIDRFPDALKDKAPRIVFKDGGWDFSYAGEAMIPNFTAKGLCDAMECNPGLTDVEARLKDIDIEGVAKELIFPQRLFGLLMRPDLDNRDLIFNAYNEQIALECAKGQGRLFAVMVPNYWDPENCQASIDKIVELGGRGLLIPIKPGKHEDGSPIHYNDGKMDPFWKAAEASGLPLVFHIGEAHPTAIAGAAGVLVITQMQGFRHAWGQLVFGGVFDRFPGLRAVFVEGGIAWVASCLHDADMAYNHFPNAMIPALTHAPSWYWHNHCYATFMTDPVGLELLHRIGPDRVMWSSDYPHQESTLGYSRSAVDAVFKATSVENAQKIVGKTALEVFNMY